MSPLRVTEAAIARALQGAVRGARPFGRELGAVEVRPDGSVFIVLVPMGEVVRLPYSTGPIEEDDPNGW